MRRWIVCLLAVLMVTAALAELPLPRDTQSEAALADYMARVNERLTAVGNAPVNSVFMCFPTVASLGITAEDNAEVPEQVELTVTMDQAGLKKLQVRVANADLFGPVAAACISAAAPDAMTMQEALKQTQPYVKRVKSKPDASYEDVVIEQNGPAVRTYYAYYVNQYQDQINWLQMTLIFPMTGYTGGVAATPTPSVSQPEDEYEGIDVRDGYTHFEVFTTATPEPDSPAGESKLGM